MLNMNFSTVPACSFCHYLTKSLFHYLQTFIKIQIISLEVSTFSYLFPLFIKTTRFFLCSYFELEMHDLILYGFCISGSAPLFSEECLKRLLVECVAAPFLEPSETIGGNEWQVVTSESQIRFDALSTELLDWILKSKTAIQATEIKEYKKMQETSEMKKKLKVKHKTKVH